VLQAGKATSPKTKRALECLCETYWYPLYVFLRRRGITASDAEDYTQAFIARVLEKDFLGSADPQRGRFRSFLLTMLRRFLATELERQQAQKRGGKIKTLSLDFRRGEDRYQAQPVDRWTPERLYDRRWALTVLEQALTTLREEFAAKG
jgi:RNA polymerase sigma-70 factor (ECF subfamily)